MPQTILECPLVERHTHQPVWPLDWDEEENTVVVYLHGERTTMDLDDLETPVPLAQ